MASLEMLATTSVLPGTMTRSSSLTTKAAASNLNSNDYESLRSMPAALFAAQADRFFGQKAIPHTTNHTGGLAPERTIEKLRLTLRRLHLAEPPAPNTIGKQAERYDEDEPR